MVGRLGDLASAHRQPQRAGDGGAVAVFDVGGTSVRSALLDGQGVLRRRRTLPSPSRSRWPGVRTPELQDMLVTLLAGEARRLARHSDVELAGVAFGAAIDARTGVALGSGPLWGADSGGGFDLRAALTAAAPEFAWAVANDVTANAAALAALPEHRGLRRLVAVTVGTGIALRTIDVRSGRIATSADSGLQGEVGHLPASFSLAGEARTLTCDCGVDGHLSAYSSGSGIARLLASLAAEGAPWLRGEGSHTDRFLRALDAGEPAAQDVLDAVTRPLAATLLSVLTIDADVERLVLAGGVPYALGQRYLTSLVGNMESLGLYGSVAPLAGKVAVADPRAEIGLVGAGLITRAAPGTAAGRRRWVVPGDEPKHYELLLTHDLLDPGARTLRSAIGLRRSGHARRLVVCDPRVWEHYSTQIDAALQGGSAAISLETILLDVDEQTKALPAVTAIVDAFDRFGLLRRSEPVLAIGGGVLLDVVGLAASVYRRGVPYVKVPTTLLAMIDAAIGVKTAINYDGAKSRLGTYYMPKSVLVDPVFLRTLDVRQYRNGLAESLKIALVADAGLFETLEANAGALAGGAPDEDVEHEVIHRSITAMLDELTGNLTEARLERLPDFGHTFSGALEMRLGEETLHGECVAMDMALTVLISQGRGLLDPSTAERILGVIAALGLPVVHPAIEAGVLRDALSDARRHRDGLQRVPLLCGLGAAVFANDVTEAELCAALDELQRRTPAQIR